MIGPFPTTSTNAKYILLVIDVFSRYVWLRALADKSAKLVASTLFSIIAEFGHPKILSSDNGKEFVNSIIEHLLLLFQIEHRNSTSYYPQGNGIAERSVRVTIDLLRKKLIESSTEEWDILLPSVQIGINSRIHSLLGSSPFSVMFNRQLNPFKHFANVETYLPSEDSIQERLNLATEILYPAIQQRVSSKTSKMNKNWNENHNLINIKSGDIVMIKITTNLSKLKPPYVGPYEVIRITRGGSVVLKSATGLLSRNYSPSQLKRVCASELTNKFYVEKIVDDKDSENGKLYRVRWVGYQENEDTWEPISSFDDKGIVESYTSTKNDAVTDFGGG